MKKLRSRAFLCPPWGQKGLTLVEVLVAAVLLTMASISFLGLLSSSYIVLQRAVIYHRATELAKEKIESLHNVPIEDIYPVNSALFNPSAGFCGPGGAGGPNGGDVVDNVDYLRPADPNGGNYTPTGTAPKGNYLITDRTLCIPDPSIPGGEVGLAPNAGTDAVLFAPPECLDTKYYFYWDKENAVWRDVTNDREIDFSKPVDDLTGPPYSAHCVDGSGKPYPLPKPGRMGFYVREVRVKAYNRYDAAAQVEYQSFGPDPLGFNAPIKQVQVTVRWRALKEEQSFVLETLFSRVVPKFGFLEKPKI